VLDVRRATRMPGLSRTTALGLAGADELPQLHADQVVRFAVSDAERHIERMRAGEHRMTGAKSG
jgi:hypothetical protein